MLESHLNLDWLDRAVAQEPPAPVSPPPEPIVPPELLSPGLLLADPRIGWAHPLYVALGVLFGLLLVGSVLAAVLAPRLLKGHKLRVRLLRRLAGALGTVAGLGLFWCIARVVGMPLFARPLWLWFTLIALVAVVGYAVYYWRREYPRALRAYDEVVRRRRWMPTPRRRAAVRRR
jgi:hypothetical protein